MSLPELFRSYAYSRALSPIHDLFALPSDSEHAQIKTSFSSHHRPSDDQHLGSQFDTHFGSDAPFLLTAFQIGGVQGSWGRIGSWGHYIILLKRNTI